jgi:prepilin-type processing-associated H-X9-DG protein
MRRPTPRSEASRALLRAYLLGTASEADRARVEEWIAASEAWQQALDRETEALARLDTLPEAVPGRDLVDAALRQIREELPDLRGTPADWLRKNQGLTVALVAAAVFLMVLLPATRYYQSRVLHNMSRNDFMKWGLVLKMYSGENRDQFPPASRYDGLWVPDIESLWPEYVNDPKMLVNPSVRGYKRKLRQVEALVAQKPVDWQAVTRIMAEGMVYTGHAIRSGEDTRQLLAKADTSGPGRRVMPLREGVERFFITDINNPAASTSIQSNIPVLFEPIHGSLRRPSGKYNVLYLDGHVEPVELGTFPATDDGAGLLALPRPD